MREYSWSDCLDSGNSLKITTNKEKAASLVETAEGRVRFLEGQKITEQGTNYLFEGFYTSIIELLQAILSKNGYRVINHICLGFFIRDELKRNDLFNLFDDLRYKRNSLVYYGNRMNFEVAKDAINKAKRLIKELKIILKDM